MKRQTALLLTGISAVICGCPGLGALCFGSFFALIGMVPGAQIDVFGSQDPTSAILLGTGMACLGILGIVIPIIVWLVTRRKIVESPVIPEEPIPPTA